MDWIERWLHISPDGGNGALEALYLAVFLLIILTITFAFRHRLKVLFLRYLEQLGKRGNGDRFDP